MRTLKRISKLEYSGPLVSITGGNISSFRAHEGEEIKVKDIKLQPVVLTESFPNLWENIYIQEDYHISRCHDQIYICFSVFYSDCQSHKAKKEFFLFLSLKVKHQALLKAFLFGLTDPLRWHITGQVGWMLFSKGN